MDKAQLMDRVEVEMERILAEQHGCAGIRVFIDRETGSVSSSQQLPDELLGKVFALAVKRAILEVVREEERGRQD